MLNVLIMVTPVFMVACLVFVSLTMLRSHRLVESRQSELIAALYRQIAAQSELIVALERERDALAAMVVIYKERS